MRSVIFLAAMLLAAPAAVAAEDFRVMKLEQDMRTLERHVQTLQRQVSELQRELRRPDRPLELGERDSAAAQTDDKWLSAAAWERVKSGMSELQVIEILGKPTAMRPDARERRALVYTLEIGTTGFLSGSISFENGAAVEVRKPALK